MQEKITMLIKNLEFIFGNCEVFYYCYHLSQITVHYSMYYSFRDCQNSHKRDRNSWNRELILSKNIFNVGLTFQLHRYLFLYNLMLPNSWGYRVVHKMSMFQGSVPSGQAQYHCGMLTCYKYINLEDGVSMQMWKKMCQVKQVRIAK